MKKQPSQLRLFLWIFSATLAAGFLLFLLVRPLLHSASSFALPKADKVRQLTFEQGKKRVQLSKHGSSWHINGGGEAQQDKVAEALYALQMLEVSYPIATENLHGDGLRVTASGRFGKLRSYTLYQMDSLTVGVLRSGKPYALEVRGNEYLNLFSLLSANAESWRKTLIVNILPSEIKSIAVEDLGKPQRSFTLSLDSLKSAQLQEIYSGKIFTKLNAEKVKRYLSYFNGVSAERYATELSEEEVEEIMLSSAAYIITIKNRRGETQTIKLFYRALGEEFDDFGRPAKVDLNRCYLQQNNDPLLALALWTDFDILIKEPKFFQ
ncbi:MAG: hypothetical protein LBU92_04650 [Prevotellaceae bacterium]|jgi:hypothetical protein|nr:hypothetical protein [Prevotellaceae bacterium]